MATSDWGVNHPLAVKAWSRKLYHDVIGESFVGKFMGKSDTSLFQIKSELSKDAGDKVTFGLRSLLTGNGIQGDNTLEGNEEALVTYNDSLFINQLRHAVRSGGKMSEQRVPFSVREEARMALQDWWIERLETSVANHLTGNTDQADTRYTGNNATVAPTASSRIIVGGGEGTEASLSATTTHAIKMSDLDKAVAIAKTAVSGGRQRIRPIRVDGKSMYVVFLHPDQIRQLRADASTAGNFFDIQKAQLQGGKISDNPILTGGEFVYNGCIVHEWSYLPNVASSVTSNTSYRRGVFCGAQSLAIAFGGGTTGTNASWEEDLFDYGNQLGVSGGMIFGTKKTVFNSIDFGTIVLSGYAPAAA